jgi:hypothetical protein
VEDGLGEGLGLGDVEVDLGVAGWLGGLAGHGGSSVAF